MIGRPAFTEEEQRLWVSTAILLGYVVRTVYERAVPVDYGITDQGFYYNFSMDQFPAKEDLEKLEQKMLELLRRGLKLEVEEFSLKEFKDVAPAKAELLEKVGYKLGEKVKVAKLNGYCDVLLGEAAAELSSIKAVKLLNVSSHLAAEDLVLVRIHGISFSSKERLKEYLRWLEEVRKRDHRFIGRKLELFAFFEEAGSGLAIFYPKGTVIREELMKLVKEVNRRLGYQEVFTPHIYRAAIWKTSGHYDMYRDKMVLFTVEGQEYGLKPMNCPGHILIYKSKTRSYKDLPVKLAEFGTVYRWEQRGELYGLLRVRGFTQDDGHAFLRPDQVKDEIKSIVLEIFGILTAFGFGKQDVKVYVSTRPEEFIGTVEQWEEATKVLKEALEEIGVSYQVKEGEGAFYGPKIDVHFRDCLGRWWQCSTIQVDFALPERFKLEYVAPDGSKKRPVLIHRALLGSVERFMAVLIEHFAGRLPTWLSPIQVRVLPISERQQDYAEMVLKRLESSGVRADLDPAGETLQKRIKKAHGELIPYIVIVGDEEKLSGTVTIRARGNVLVRSVKLDDFLASLKREIEARSLELTAISQLSSRSQK